MGARYARHCLLSRSVGVQDSASGTWLGLAILLGNGIIWDNGHVTVVVEGFGVVGIQ